MKEPRWISKAAVLLLHAQTLASHGGLEGIRDEGALESALARPKNRFAYENVSDPARLGAAYVFGITRNHPFVDGNKRAAFAALGVFLGKNGWRLVADQTDASDTILAAAAGKLTEEALATWINKHVVRAESKEAAEPHEKRKYHEI
jgi:death-on-curing protein